MSDNYGTLPGQSNGFDVVLWLFCWPWAVMRWIGRRKHWSRSIQNMSGILAAVMVLIILMVAFLAAGPVPVEQTPANATAPGAAVKAKKKREAAKHYEIRTAMQVGRVLRDEGIVSYVVDQTDSMRLNMEDVRSSAGVVDMNDENLFGADLHVFKSVAAAQAERQSWIDEGLEGGAWGYSVQCRTILANAPSGGSTSYADRVARRDVRRWERILNDLFGPC